MNDNANPNETPLTTEAIEAHVWREFRAHFMDKMRPTLDLIDRALVEGTDALTPEERETVRPWLEGGAE